MALTFENKRVIITAAAGGIGHETVRAFAEAGAKIFICDIDEKNLDNTINAFDGVNGIAVDVSDQVQFQTFFDHADRFLGGLDILVNNAGTAGPTAAVEDINLEDWHNCVAVNLTSAFIGIQQAIPRLKVSGGGSIVNLSSAAGKFGFAMRSPYVASKWGIVGLTRTTAIEVGPFGIRCNCIQPGPVDGDRINRVIKAKAEAEGLSENQARDEMMSISALRTFIPPSHIANMILYLCSDKGSTITGQALSIDGGLEGLG